MAPTRSPRRDAARWIRSESTAQRHLAARLEAAHAAGRAGREREARAFLVRVAAAGLDAGDGRRLRLGPAQLPSPRRWPSPRLLGAGARPCLRGVRERERRLRPLALPGFPAGIAAQLLSLDPATGACSLKLRVAAGTALPGGYSDADLELFILAGELEIGSARRAASSYLYVPRGVALPAIRSPRGAGLLAFYGGPPSFRASDSDDPRADRDRLVALDAERDVRWRAATTYPAPVSGRLVKVLRVDAASRALTALYALAPGYRRDAVFYHDAAVEEFVIAGARRSLAAGTATAGSYSYLPPYVNDGPETAPRGALLLVRSSAELVDHVHADPWSTPAENRAAALRLLRLTRPALLGRPRPRR